MDLQALAADMKERLFADPGDRTTRLVYADVLADLGELQNAAKHRGLARLAFGWNVRLAEEFIEDAKDWGNISIGHELARVVAVDVWLDQDWALCCYSLKLSRHKGTLGPYVSHEDYGHLGHRRFRDVMQWAEAEGES